MSFKNKVVVITGASSGIGAAASTSFAKEGAQVVIIGRNEARLKTVAEKCSSVGKKPLLITADLAKDYEVDMIIPRTIKEFGRIDVLVNNAGFGKSGNITDGKFLEAYDAIMQVNVRAVIKLTSAAVPHLIKTKGNILNISSIGALMPPVYPDFGPYSVSKAALDHFSRIIALELAPSGVRVNNINPGPVATEFFDVMNLKIADSEMENMCPLKRVCKPQEIADIIMFVASDKAVGITGSNFVVDGGLLLKH